MVVNKRRTSDYCALLALDVKSIQFRKLGPNWKRIGVSEYLASLAKDYLSKRTLWYETDKDPKEYIDHNEGTTGLGIGLIVESHILSHKRLWL